MRQLITAFLLVFTSLYAQAQSVPTCEDTVPYHLVNLVGQPAGSWTSPAHERIGYCCSANGGDNCTSFEVVVDPGAAMINLEITSGALPTGGSLYYQVACSTQVTVGTAQCLVGAGPFAVTFCKGGNNQNTYKITSIPKPTFPADATVRLGCVKTLSTLGMTASSVTWTSVYPGTTGLYNSYLSCTNCASPNYTPDGSAPAYIDYKICGTPTASSCGFVAVCDTVRVYNVTGLTSTVTPTSASFCAGGGVTLTASAGGGSPPYTYIWKSSGTTQVGTGLTYFATASTVYTLEVRDAVYEATNCPALQSSVPVSVAQPPVVSAGADQTVCTGSPTAFLNGSVTNATGGTWSGGGSGSFSPDANTLTASYTPGPTEIAAGFVNLTLTSTGAGGGCVDASDVVKIVYPPLLTVSLGNQSLSCNNSSATLTPTVGGGTTPYTYSWSNNSVNSTISVGSGYYYVTVSDGRGCTSTDDATVTAPATLGLIVTSTDATTIGASNGTATATPSGGTTPYTYSWSPTSQTTQTATGLSYGIYNVTVRDANNCSLVGSVIVNDPACSNLAASISGQVNVLCNGNSTGSATVAGTGGPTGMYTYSWNTVPPQITATATGLSAGTYLATIYDGSCQDIVSVVITEPTQLANNMAHTNVAVVGGTNGTATANPSGGTSPYTYLWSNSGNTQAISNLSGGTYTLTITDANGCSFIDSVRIIEPPCDNIVLNISSTNVSCFGGSNGTATAQLLFGNPPYTYSWNTTPAQNTQTATGLQAGTYVVVVRDAQNCLDFKSITITAPSVLSLGLVKTDVICSTDNNGTIDLTVSGGTFPYTYVWSNGIQVEDQIFLSNGTYSVTVTDSKGCTKGGSSTIVRPSAISSSSSKSDVTCFGAADGSINATISGGVVPYTFSWSNAQTTEDISGLVSGQYVLSLTDANTCNNPTSVSVIIDQPTIVDVSQFVISCPVPNSGISNVFVVPTGGNGPYRISFDNGGTYGTVGNYSKNLAVNATYTVIVKDVNNCVSLPDLLTINPAVTISNISYVKCLPVGVNTTTVTVTPAGGAGVWWQISSDNGANFLPQGTYTTALTVGSTYFFMVQDSLGCTSPVTTLVIPDTLKLTSSTSAYAGGYNVSCNGSSNGSINLSVTGGTTAYTYSWTSGQITEDISNITAGNYSVTVTDANTCTKVLPVTLTQPVALASSASVTTNYNGNSVSCNGSTNGAADLTVTGGTTAYTYAWSNSQTTQDVSSLGSGTYTVTVSDANNCTTTASVTLTQPTALTLTATATNVTCSGLSDGSINLTPSGGTSPYTYSWSNSQITQDISGLSAADYSVTVTDANGCTSTRTVTVTQPVALTTTIAVSSNYNGQQISCSGLSNGSIDLTVAGGTTNYTYLWTNTTQTTQDITGLAANTYSVRVTDANGCTSTKTITVTQPTVLTTTIAVSSNYNGQQISCNGLSNGSINLTVAGGTTNYTYLWTNTTQTTQDITGLAANTYSVRVTDVNGCSTTTTITVTQPTALTTTVAVSSNYNGQQISCNGLSDGSINLTVAGGTTNYTYLWTNTTQTTQDITGLAANTYSVRVTDVNGCSTTTTITVTQPTALTTTVAVSSNYNGQQISCNGLSNGSVNLTVAGGTTNYTYLWTNTTQTTQDITGLAANTYSVRVTDVNGCSTTTTITVTQPAAVTSTIAVSSNYNGQNISCNGLSDGSIDLSVSGGTTNYTYSWSNSAATQDISGLAAGTYTVLVTDVNGCTTTNTITLTEPVALSSTVAVSSNYNGQHISCNGLSDGSVDLSVSGGTTNYTYSWSNSAATQDISGLAAGTYTVLVTDVNGCTTTNTITLTEPAALTTTIAVSSNYNGQHISCNGLSDGAIDLTVSGGVLNYTYSWSNSAATQDINGLAAGTYTVLVTDVNGCTTANTITLTEPAALTTTIAVSSNYNGQHISCNGLSDGSIDLTVSGGTTNYTYSWSNSAATQDISSLTAGTYTVLVTDVNGCTTANTITLTEPAALTTTIAVSSNYNGRHISCNGLSDGSIDLTVSGGVVNYTYSWSNAAVTEDISGLSAGTYTVLVTDVNGCTTTNTITLTEPAVLTTSISVSSNYNGQHISCNGLSDGSIDLTIAGGTTNYTYSWSNAAVTEDISGLAAGTYTVLVADVNGCTTTNTITLTEPAVLSSTIAISSNYNGQHISCNGLSDGSIDLTIAGGTTNYTYSWSNSAVTEDISGLPAGTYTVLVTDVNGCTTTNTITLIEPAVLSNTIAISSNYNGQHISCNGLSDGSIDLSVSGGTTNYTYSWSNSAVTEDISGLAAGTYTVLVTDVNGCTTTNTITLTEPVALSSTVAVSSNYNGQHISCNGLSDGSIDLSVSGGTTNYTYSWSNSAATEDINGLAAGTYTVLVTDVNGCTTTNTITLTEPAAVTSTIAVSSNYNGQNISCNGLSDGSIDLSVSGGTTNYTYSWSNSAATQDISGLAAGTYTVLVTDVNGCTTTNTITLTEPVALSSTVAVSSNYNGQHISCNGLSDGSVDLSVSGGTTNYTYSWSNSAATQDISGLAAGTYTVLVTDVNGCTTTNTITLTEPVALTSTVAVSSNYNGQHVSCNGLSDGSIDLSVSGGTTNYTYSWSNSAGTEDISGLTAGTYTVLVTDVNGCTTTNTITLTEPAALTSSVAISSNFNGQNISCNGLSDGSIDLTVAGGTTNYTYSWSNSAATQDISGLTAGTYTVLITDVNGCTTTNTMTLTEPAALTSSVAISSNFNGQHISCNGLSNGGIDLTVAGGTTNYTYSWSNSAATQDISGLTAGTYTVLVTDVNGCTTTNTITVTDPPVLASVVSIVSQVSCKGGNDGSANVFPSGGTAPYTYLWTNGQVSTAATGLSAAMYSVTVTDVNGCSITKAFSITEPTALTASLTVTHVSCNGGNDGTATVTAGGGTVNYTYVWSNNQSSTAATGLSLGTYTVTITDGKGCVRTDTAAITQPTVLTGTTSITPVLCNGGSTGTATVAGGGGTLPYTYLWTAGSQTSATATGLALGTYSVTITDGKGCTRTDTAAVTQPSLLRDTVTTTDVLCNGGNTGTATVAGQGGIGPYTYVWSNTQSAATATGLSLGTYSVTITDANGCSRLDSAIVSEPAALASSVATTEVLCNGGNTGAATLSVSGGLTPYTYSWSNGNATSTATGLSAGIYYVTATDSNGCTIRDTAVVNQPLALTGSMGSTPVLCHGDSSGAASFTASGGTAPYTYLWTNGQTTSAASGLIAGSHSVTVTDTNGCTITVPVAVFEPTALTYVMSSTVASCNGGNDGTATVTVVGGVAPYTYSWNAGAGSQTTSTASGLAAGTYFVGVADSNGCAFVASVVVSENSLVQLSTTPGNPSCYMSSNGQVNLSVTGGVAPYSYIWSNGDTLEDISGVPAGTYIVIVTDANQCSKTDTIVLTHPDSLYVTLASPVTNAGYHVTPFNGTNGSIVTTVFGGTSPYQFFWTNGSSDQDLTGLPAGSYTVQVTDSAGCIGIASITLIQPLEFGIPGGMSPNGDGKNDFFVIHGMGEYDNHSLQVFNRWGDEVWSSADYKNDWAGTNKSGEPLPDGTYFIILRVNFGEKDITGYVDIRR